MVTRRFAVAEFVVSAVGLVTQLYSRRELKRHDDYENPETLSLVGVGIGILQQVLFHVAYDRDWMNLRTSRYRTAGYFMIWGMIQRRVLSEDSQRGSGTGSLIGTILYRFWYGVVRSPLSV